MLQMPLILFIIRVIPEGILLVTACSVFTNNTIPKFKIIQTGILFAICIYLIRLLPIHFGVHTILSIIAYIFIMNKINGITLLKVIPAVLLSEILLFTCDLISVSFYTNVLNVSDERLAGETLITSFYSIPSLIMVFIVINIYKFIKQKAKKGVTNESN